MEIIFEQEIRTAVTLNGEALDAIEEGFTLLADGEVQTPPIMRIEVPENNGEVDVKAAKVNGLDLFAIKISSGFFDNPQRGLPSGSGLMVLLSTATGQPEALLVDNGYLTDVRTAAAGAIAAKYLAKPSIDTVGIIGAGTQAQRQLEALTLVRKFRQVMVYSRSVVHTRQYAEEMAARLNVPVEPCESAEEVVRSADLVVTTTPAIEPIVFAEWLHPGLHITAMGSDAEFKQELDPEILAQADKVCCDLISQCTRFGEWHHAVEAGIGRNDLMELGALTSKRLLGRTHPDHVTVCDLTGTGVQDTMIATYALKRILAMRRNSCVS